MEVQIQVQTAEAIGLQGLTESQSLDTESEVSITLIKK